MIELNERDEIIEKRQQRLADRVRGLRTRAGAGSRDRWLLVVGGALVALGLLLVILGWVGASGSYLVFEQIPYLISGGVLGLGLIVIGAFTYFAYWLTTLVRENRDLRRQLLEQQQQTAASLAAITELLSKR